MPRTPTFWFRPKNYGYGFFPISWEGWAMTGAFIVIIFTLAWLGDFFTPTGPDAHEGFTFLWQLITSVTIFHLIAAPRTEGEVGWRWGGPLIPTAPAKKVVAKKKVATAKRAAPKVVAKKK